MTALLREQFESREQRGDEQRRQSRTRSHLHGTGAVEETFRVGAIPTISIGASGQQLHVVLCAPVDLVEWRCSSNIPVWWALAKLLAQLAERLWEEVGSIKPSMGGPSCIQ